MQKFPRTRKTSRIQRPPTGLTTSTLPTSNSQLVPSFSSEELAIGGLGSATSARLNAHILLGLSILLLSGSVNARPLDVDVASVRSGFNFGGLNNPVGGLGEQIAESFVKLFNLNHEAKDESSPDNLLNAALAGDPLSQDATISNTKADVGQSSFTASQPLSELNSENGANNHDQEPSLRLPQLPHPNILEHLSQNPAFSLAFGAADLLHKLRELFVGIAIAEGEERGLVFNYGKDSQLGISIQGEETMTNQGEAQVQPGLQLTFGIDPISTSAEKPTDDQSEEIFSFDSSPNMPGHLDLPDTGSSLLDSETANGNQSASTNSDLNQVQDHLGVFGHFNSPVNPYAALAFSSVLATLFVIGLVVGRHYYLSSKVQINEEDDLERGPGGDHDEKIGEGGTTTDSMENSNSSLNDAFDEKAPMEVIVHHVSVQGLGHTNVEDKEALQLLADVANAALAASAAKDNAGSPGADEMNEKTAVIDLTPSTPILRAVDGALEALQQEIIRSGTPVFNGSSAAIPILESHIPTLVFTNSTSTNASDVEEKDDSPSSSVSSSYMSFAEGGSVYNTPLHLPHQLPSLGQPPRSSIQIERKSGLLTAALLSRRSFDGLNVTTPFYSPASSFIASPHRPSVDLPSRPPTPRHPGALALYDDEEAETNATQNGTTGLMIPPAHLSQTALQLALALPATEWIFQFIVVFIGMFGMWMQPINSGRSNSRRSRA